ncbi:MAG: hypothetical protein K6E85_16640 [Lachnospiraceae bacterium]|nr:hypothetical protein [Lachnospiraceae bacterium]
MKKTLTKIMAIILGVALITAGVGSSAYALTGDKDEAKDKAQELVTNLIAEDKNDKPVKDETVYVIAGQDGSIKKIIVSDWLKNVTNSAELNDVTELTGIEEVKGEDHTFTTGGENSRVWDAEGNDIYYQGNIEKEIPVTMKISYKLDGRDISAEELKGRSGELVIRYDYENKQFEKKLINGNEEKIYVPFAMLTGMMLNNDVFTNVEVSNGKILNDGDRTVVIGFALPGLRENLALENEKMAEIADYFEIKAHVEDYEPAMAVTVATNGLFDKVNTEKLDSFDGLGDSMNELTDAVGQLIDGSSQLYDGLNTLLEKSGELKNGIDALAAGAAQLKDGAAQLDAGAGQLAEGAAALSTGLDTLKGNNEALNGGAKQVFETLLATAQSQLAAAGIEVPELTVENYAEVLDGVIASLDEDAVYAKAQEAVKAAVEEKRDYIETQVTAAVRAQVEEKVKEGVKAQVEEGVKAAVKAQVEEGVRAAVEAQVEAKVEATVKAGVEQKVKAAMPGQSNDIYEAAIAQQMASAEVKALIEENTAQQMGSNEVAAIVAKTVEDKMAEADIAATIQATIDAKLASDEITALTEKTIEEKMASDEVKGLIAENTEAQVQKAITDNMASDEVKAKLAQASEGVAKIAGLKASLDSYNTFYKGLAAYTDGVAQAAEGAVALKDGAAQLKEGSLALSNGSTALNTGLATVKDNMPALIDGVTQLKDGAGQLSDGMNEFNEKGIEKLVEAVDGDLAGLVERLKAVAEVSKNYKSFSGLSDQMDGEVKFIYKIAE